MISEKAHIRPTGKVIATGVTYEDFLTKFEGQHVEWVYGEVIEMSPVTDVHNNLSVFLIMLFKAVLGKTGGGWVSHDPMVMRPSESLPARAPDIQVVLPQNMEMIKTREVSGAADIVVEIISKGSHRTDRIEKFQEYEHAGVKEYWILDSVRKESLFYQLNEERFFEPILPDEQGIYQSKVLPNLRLDITIFWRDPLPEFWEIADLVTAMLKEESDE